MSHIEVIIDDPVVAEWVAEATPATRGLALRFGMEAANYIHEITLSQQHVQPVQQPAIAPLIEQVQPAARIGQVGEKFIEDILKQRFNIHNTTKTAHAGDIALTVHMQKIIVEVKNYKSTIPTHQVEKFRNDLTTAGAFGGVFISLNTPISLMTPWSLVWEPTASSNLVPCVYMQSAQPDEICAAVELVAHWIHLRMHTFDPVCQTIGAIEHKLLELATARTEMQTMSAGVAAATMKTYSRLTSCETSVRDLLQIAKTDLECGVTSIITLPAFAKYTLEQREFINNLMSSTPGQWKFVGKKYTNQCLCLHILAKPYVELPITVVSGEWLATNYLTFGTMITLGNTLTIQVDVSTFALITELVSRLV